MILRPWPGIWLPCLSIFSTSLAYQPISSPSLDLNSLGQVAVGGDFSALSLYNYVGQREGSQGNGTQSVLHQLPNGMYDVLAATDANIEDMCTFTLKNGTVAGVVVGGNFTSVGGIGAQSIAFIDAHTYTVTPAPGIQGIVNALLCDTETQTVYVGGVFEAADSTNAIAWLASGSWANLPFAGFDAPVTSITKAPNGHIVFGGSFTGLKNMSSTSSNTQRPSQIININSATITSVANTTAGNAITCPSNISNSQAWQLQDNTAGSWTASIRYGFEPSVLRLSNANIDGRGVKTWRLTALPNTGIMNFTYTDPQTGKAEYCDATCPLAQNSSLPYQDFQFVNRVGMNGFRIDVSAWYGQGAALDGVEIFQNDTFVYAIESFNEPTCLVPNSSISKATATGSWTETPSGGSYADYLTASVDSTTLNTTNVVFQPDIEGSGNFTVVVYTPGCMQDNSCSMRGTVNITGSLTSDGGNTFSTVLAQTNDYEKYDQVYVGKIDSTGSFRPSVTLTPIGDRPTQLVVASRVKFSGNPSTGGLNGLFDFDPNSAVVDTDFSKSAINNAGTKLHPNARVSCLETSGDTIYAAGTFSDEVFQNIMSFSNNTAHSLPNGGLNAPVAHMLATNDTLYIGGNFTGTAQQGPGGLQNVAAYVFARQAWMALGAGVDGPVTEVVPFNLSMTNGQTEPVIGFSGSFSNILATGNSSRHAVDGFAVWVPSQKDWLQNIKPQQQQLEGMLCSYTNLPNGTWLGAGSLVSLGQAFGGVAGLRQTNNNINLQQLPVQFETSTSSSSPAMSKRALLNQQNITGVVAGAYDIENGRNVTILGGHFTAQTNSGNIQNLLFLDGAHGNNVTGLPTGIDSNSTFLALTLQNNVLFAGGLITGQINNGTRLRGLVLYDMSTSNYRSPQPAALTGGQGLVNSIVAQPGTSNMFVGGSFESTGQDLSCLSVCIYDTSSNTWQSAGAGLDGTVTALHFIGNTHLIAAGNFSLSGNETSLAQYDTKAQTWNVYASAPLPGPVTAFTATTDDGQFWVSGTSTSNGTTYLVKVVNGDLKPVTGVFQQGTEVLGLQVMNLNKGHGSSQYLDDKTDLLVLGSLSLTGFGFASAALFDGTSMTPFILSVDSQGQPGSISTIFSSRVNPASIRHHFGHSKGLAILVAFCAALGTLFLIIVAGMIVNQIQRRRAGYSTVPNVPYQDKNVNINRVPPDRLFASMGQKAPGAPAV